MARLQDNGFAYLSDFKNNFHFSISSGKTTNFDATQCIQNFNPKEIPPLLIQDIVFSQRDSCSKSKFDNKEFFYKIFPESNLNSKIEINSKKPIQIEIKKKSEPDKPIKIESNKPIKIQKPLEFENKKLFNIHHDKSREQKTYIKTITGRTFDSSPSFTLNIDKSSYLFNAPEMLEKHLIADYRLHTNFSSIFISSLYPDSAGGISHFLQQNYIKHYKYSITGPKEIPDVIMLKTTYFGKNIPDINRDIRITQNYEDNLIKVTPVVHANSISFEVSLKSLKKRFLVVDCRSLSDIKALPDPFSFDFVVHMTIPQVLVHETYFSFFNKPNNPEEKKQLLNICFMPSGIISNHLSNNEYNQRANKFLQPLASGKTLSPPPGFTNFTVSGSKFNITSGEINAIEQGELVNVDLESTESRIGESILSILSKLSTFEPSLPEFEEYAVTLLGSGTKFVSPTRNLSGYLIHTKYGFVVFDPSEGYFNQLCRKFGPKNTEFILKNIECIWISHYHQDHILGSMSLLNERSKLTDKEIYFFAPQKFIGDIQKVSQYYRDFHVIYHNRESANYVEKETEEDANKDDGYKKYGFDPTKEHQIQYTSVPDTFKINDHLTIQSIDVSHCEHTKGCMLLIDNKTKIAFSGDHGYKKDYFDEVFKNCDLLLHEATFPTYVKNKIGFITNHCYIDEAINTAIYMNAKVACLIHFSQRFNEENLLYRPRDNIMLGFDFLEFTSENALDVFKNCSQKSED